MPIHDWSGVNAVVFHAFRHRWIGGLCDVLNAELLPEDHFALIEAAADSPSPDILAGPAATGRDEAAGSGVEVRGHIRIAVRQEDGRIVAVVEILSSESKASDASLRAFTEMMAKMIVQGVHLLVVNLFPPGVRAPRGSTRRSGTSWRSWTSSWPPAGR